MAGAVAAAMFFRVTLSPDNAGAGDPSTALAQPVEIGNRIYLTSEATKGLPGTQTKTSFECTEPIYAVMESTQIEHGNHKFLVQFVDPDGKERERVEFDFVARGQNRIWGWLRLHRGAGGTLFSVFDSAAGMEDMIGNWTAKFHLDSEFVQEQSFEVLC